MIPGGTERPFAVTTGPSISLVVIASSLGGLEVIEAILSELPADFTAPVVLVQHTRSWRLVDLLSGYSRLPATMARDGDSLCAGTLYVAPPGRHLTIDSHRRFVLSDGSPVSFARPAADLLFTAAADHFPRETLGVVLSGRLRDGAAGAFAIRQAGGIVIAQDPKTCAAPGMPEATIGLGAANLVLPSEKIASALVSLTMDPGGKALFGLEELAA